MRKQLLQMACAVTLVWLGASTAGSQVSQSTANRPTSAGPALQQTSDWISHELPRAGADTMEVTYGGTHWTSISAIESATISDCILTLRTSDFISANQEPRSSAILAVPLKDLDLAFLVGKVDSVPIGNTESKPRFVFLLVALKDRGKPFTLEEKHGDGPFEAKIPWSLFRVSMRTLDMARRGAIAVRRAAVLCGAQDPTVATATEARGSFTAPNGKDHLDLHSDGTYSERYGTETYRGTYSVRHDTVTLKQSSGVINSGFLVGNTFLFQNFDAWEKQGGKQPSGALAQAPVTARKSQSANAAPQTSKTAQQSQSVKPARQSPTGMTNDDVVKLVAANIAERVIITSIRQESAKNFDLSVTGLIALKKARVSDAIISAMQERGAPAQAASANNATSPPRAVATEVPPKLDAIPSRPSEAEVQACVRGRELVYLSHEGMIETRVVTIGQVEFGTTMISQGGKLELAMGAPKDTKIFPTRIHMTKNNQQYVQEIWVFKDSFGKLKCENPD